MYLSRAELDPTRRETMVALISPQKFHGAVENAFAGARRRRLWRLDQLGEKLYLLLLSEERPDLTALCAQFGTGAPPETRPYDPLLERVTAGSCWQFRLTANPTRSKKDSADHTARGTLKPCYLEGAGRKARLCRLGGVVRSDPEADLSLQEKRHPAHYPAGCDLRGHSAGDGPGGLQGPAVRGRWPGQGLWPWPDDHHPQGRRPWLRCRAFPRPRGGDPVPDRHKDAVMNFSPPTRG